ncbi:class I SAM-dependent methyltransferase [uncultured Sphingomonas sp.]|uniref:class I SAM-dependent methyltransferase n=1 Tax=uncultured Sphingomonas sp. TaxID=158754 RepID=UPI0035CA4F10
MQPPALAQRGRAAIDFHITMRGMVSSLQREVEAELASHGITAATLPDDLDDRHTLIDATLASSDAYRLRALAAEWTARDHGPTCQAAFDEIADTLAPELAALDHGPATLELDPDLVPPDWFSRVWFHRTAGGWDASDHNGYVHGELIHKLILTRVFGADIFAQRRAAAECTPRRDYARILDMGASSGHNMVALAQMFPDAQLSGIDYSARMLEHARRVANEAGLPWRLYQRACEDSRFAGESFDLVASYNMLHELPRGIIRRMFAETFRILEPGGTMLVGDVPRYAELDRLAAWRFDHVARYGGEPYWRVSACTDLVALARELGFVDVSGQAIGRGTPYVLVATKP